MTRYTIHCPEHVLSDGRVFGTQGGEDIWFDTTEEAQERADVQTAAHAEAGMDCKFVVVDDDTPLSITPQDFVLLLVQGVDIGASLDAGLVVVEEDPSLAEIASLEMLLKDPEVPPRPDLGSV